jgi:hypothetical protein
MSRLDQNPAWKDPANRQILQILNPTMHGKYKIISYMIYMFIGNKTYMKYIR